MFAFVGVFNADRAGMGGLRTVLARRTAGLAIPASDSDTIGVTVMRPAPASATRHGIRMYTNTQTSRSKS